MRAVLKLAAPLLLLLGVGTLAPEANAGAKPAEQALSELKGGKRRYDVVQNRFFLKEGRFEVAPVAGLIPNNPFASRYIGGIHGAYHFSENLAAEGAFIYSPERGLADLKGLTNTLVAIAEEGSGDVSFQQPVETMESIVTGTLNILETLRLVSPRSRFYNAGSSESFGDTAGEPAVETTAFRPRSPYGVAKAAAAWQVANYREAYGLFACSGILFNHESPLRPERFVTRKICAAVRRIADGSGETLRLGNLDIRRDWGWAPEYVDAMWRMLQAAAPDDYVVATGTDYSVRDFVQIAFEEAGLDWERHVRFDERYLRPSEVDALVGDASLARQTLGWKALVHPPELARIMVREDLRMLNDPAMDRPTLPDWPTFPTR